MDKSGFRTLSEIILPPGSTGTDLQTAIDNAASGDTIIISGDMPLADTVTIPDGKEITIQSDDNNKWTLFQSGTTLLFRVNGNLILNNIILDGRNSGRGVEATVHSNFTMNECIIKNCTHNAVHVINAVFNMIGGTISNNSIDRNNGGGVYLAYDSTFNMTGGSISNNTSNVGGGVYMTENCSFNVTEGTISGNKCDSYGGGVCMWDGCNFNVIGGTVSGNKCVGYGGGVFGNKANITIKGGSIIGNTSQTYGGGLFLYEGVYLTIENSDISGNEATYVYGGGIFSQASWIKITGKSYITNNIAPNGDGGGIFTINNYTFQTTDKDFILKNISGEVKGEIDTADIDSYLITDADTVFNCNRASAAYAPPENAAELYPDIQFARTTITDHPMNNFDINYTEGEPITVAYTVTYDANGGIGSYTGPDTAPGGTDMVLSPAETGISRSGYTFTGWNTEPDGSGTEYIPGDSIILNCNGRLYAQWVVAERFTITYGSNGGSGSFEDSGRQFGDNYTILSPRQAGISRPGFTVRMLSLQESY